MIEEIFKNDKITQRLGMVTDVKLLSKLIDVLPPNLHDKISKLYKDPVYPEIVDTVALRTLTGTEYNNFKVIFAICCCNSHAGGWSLSVGCRIDFLRNCIAGLDCVFFVIILNFIITKFWKTFLSLKKIFSKADFCFINKYFLRWNTRSYTENSEFRMIPIF